MISSVSDGIRISSRRGLIHAKRSWCNVGTEFNVIAIEFYDGTNVLD